LVSQSTESEVLAVAGGGGDGDVGLREGMGEYFLRFLLKDTNDYLLCILRGNLFHIEGAA